MNLIILSEGGEAKSLTLRKHKKKYDKVDVGLYSYGSCFSDGFNIGGGSANREILFFRP